MSTGPLQPGLVQVASRETGEVVGYAYTVENGAGQLQRWLLYGNPHNSFEVKPPPASMAGWTLAQWQAEVPRLWRPGSFYVWAQADVYQHGGTYHGRTWTQIPAAAALPPETYPPGSKGPFQLDPTGFRVLDVRQATLSGLAYSIGGLEDAASVEYWMLPAGYQPAGGGDRAAGIAGGTEQATSLDDFIGAANQRWGSGCLFVIVGCVNHHGTAPPGAP
jgi:hypothetical protein